MNTHSKVRLAAGVLALGATLGGLHLTGSIAVPATKGPSPTDPGVAISARLEDLGGMDAELRDLRTAIEALRDAVRRLELSAERTRSRVEASETFAQSVRERISILEEGLPDSALEASGSDHEFDTSLAKSAAPDPDGALAAREGPDPIEDPIEAAAERFYAGGIDDRQTHEVVSLIEQQMAQGVLGNSALISTECNGEGCRAVVQHDSGEDALQFDLDFPSIVGERFDAFVARRTDLGDGLYETEIYLGQDAGH